MQVASSGPRQAIAASEIERRSVTERRQFLSSLAASLTGLAFPRIERATAPLVTAATTVFYANPDGRTNLVRFVVTGLDAPAGRMRVYGQGRMLIGTAGVLRTGDALQGELWLSLNGPTTVTSELEAPGLRGVQRTTHWLQPPPRWTIVWLTAADPTWARTTLDRMPPINRAVQAAIWREAGVTGNPLPPAVRLHTMDHLALLRMGIEARELERVYGLGASAIAFTEDPAALPRTAAVALAGSGIRYVLHTDDGRPPLEWWRGPDGSQVLAAQITRGGDSRALGFADSLQEMSRRVEAWLTAQDAVSGSTTQSRGRDPGERLAFLASGNPGNDMVRMHTTVGAWNRSFAYPRVLIGASDELDRHLATVAVSIPVLQAQSQPAPVEIPAVAALDELRQAREGERQEDTRRVMYPLARLLDAQDAFADPLGAIAREVETAIPGQLIVNATPFRRTDVVTLTDGTSRVVTDVPPMGYAFVIDDRMSAAEPAQASAQPAVSPVAENATFRLEIDRRSGAIFSLIARSSGREWARAEGLNAVSGAILEGLMREEIPGVGLRLTAHRWSSDLQAFRTTVTLYDALPWVDIENIAAVAPVQYRFAFAAPEPKVRWEIPAGYEEAVAPIERFAHLRWLSLEAGSDAVLFRGLDSPYLTAWSDGTIQSHAGPGRARFRLETDIAPVPVMTCARFGWGTEPFEVVPVAENPQGRLPRFGRLLMLDQPSAAIVGLKWADDGDGVIVYVQELSGTTSFLSLGYGLLAFDGARQVDFLERDFLGEVTEVPDGVAFQPRPWGTTALRLVGVRLNGV